MKSAIKLLTDWLALFRSTRARPYLLITFLVDAALVFVFLVAIQSYLPEQHGGGSELAGYALAAYGGAKLLGQLIMGRLVDREGSRRSLLIGLAVLAVGQASLMSGALEPRAVLPAAAAYGLGAAIVWPAIYASAANEFAAEERARLTSGMTVSTGLALATALGLGFLLPASFPYTGACAFCLVMLLAAIWMGRSFWQTGSIANAAVTAPAELAPNLAGVFRKIVSPQRLTFSVIILLQSAIIGSLLAIFRAYGRDAVEISFREEVLLLVPAAIAGGAAVVVGGSLSDKLGRIPLLGAGFFMTTLALWMLSVATSPGALMVIAPIAAIGMGLAFPSVGAMSMDLSRTAGAGTILAWFLAVEGVGHAAGPATAAWVDGKAGVITVLWIIGFMAGTVSVLALVPPIWANLSNNPRRPITRVRLVLSGAAKGGLMLGLAVPILTTYWAWSPSSQIYGHIISHGPRDQMQVAITFDDGPNDPWTLKIADVLDHYSLKGTFFTVGLNADIHPEIVQELVRRGHLIGNHSFEHKKQDAVLQPGYSDLARAEQEIAKVADVCPAFYRPPNGFHTPWQLHAVAKRHMHTVTWDVIPKDWKNPPPEQIVQRVLDSVQPGSIILLHDGNDTDQVTDRSSTLASLPGIIEGLESRGYQVVRLDKLLNLPPYLPTCDGLDTGP